MIASSCEIVVGDGVPVSALVRTCILWTTLSSGEGVGTNR